MRVVSIEVQVDENSAMVGEPQYRDVDMSENPGEYITLSRILLAVYSCGICDTIARSIVRHKFQVQFHYVIIFI